MARKSKEETLADIHNEAILEFDRIQMAMRDERLQCLEDRRFYSIAGAQWEGPLGEQFENKPRLEVNKIHLAVVRIFNEYRNNRISVDFVSKEGNEYSKLAETCNGLYRATEQDSQAEEAYDNAFEEGVGGGLGAWRLITEYEDDEDMDNEQQKICIEPIYDADSSVFFDLNSKRMDKKDAKSCYVITAMSPDAFDEEYGEDNRSSVAKQIYKTFFDWNTPDVVYVAEYYRVEEKQTKVHIFENVVSGQEEKVLAKELTEERAQELAALGYEEVRSRKIKQKKIHKYIMSGDKILEDCGYIAGTEIPIVMFYGKRWFVDNVERCMGHVRLAKDMQRLKNMQMSKLAEISALSPVEKPIMTPEQIAGHEQQWADDNIENYPYLLVNPLVDMNGNIMASGPVAYTKPPTIPPALAALVQMSDVDMNDILGNQMGAEQMVSNISGKAVEMIQTRKDMQAYIYMSNMAKSVQRSGEIFLSMAKEVYVEANRKMKTIGKQEEVDFIELARPIVNDKGEMEYENDLSEAKFDVYADVGPASSSKRESTVKALMGMMAVTTDQDTKVVLEAMTMLNMEGEGIDEVREYFRNKLLRMGVVKPTEEEQQQLQAMMANQQPTPQDKYFEAASKNEEAKAIEATSNTEKNLAMSEKYKAEAAKTLSELDIDQRKAVMEFMEKFQEMNYQSQNVQPTAQPTEIMPQQ